MNFISTNGQAAAASFSEAALKGLAPDGGLFMPERWPSVSGKFLEELDSRDLRDIGLEISSLFIRELAEEELDRAVTEALNFDAPLVPLEKQIYLLELFHGPTLAFKDFGARFMSRIFSALRKEREQDLIILAATSGDTGSAVARGFLGVEGIRVCLLYPSGQVSHIQEQQLTTAGQNVTALEVEGTFDDCQQLVKQAFSDPDLNEKLLLSSANSINIARLIPQMFYYFHAVSRLPENLPPIFCVPSGNFGNLTAGLMAQKCGMPASGYIAATNANDVVPHYLKTGKFRPRPSERTISNAMDVGNPSNFARIRHLYQSSDEKIRRHIWSASFSDDETKEAIAGVFNAHGYVMDPHTAVGYLAVQKYRDTARSYFGEGGETPCIILSTAHPAKFRNVIEPVIGQKVPIPARLKACLGKPKQSVAMQNEFAPLKNWLLERYGG